MEMFSLLKCSNHGRTLLRGRNLMKKL